MQILNLILQPLVNYTELFALLLTVIGGALLVMFEMIADIPVFLFELTDAFLQVIGVLGIFPRKRTKASGAPAIPGLPDGVASHFLTVLEYFG